MIKKLRLLAISCIVLLVAVIHAHAAVITFAWDYTNAPPPDFGGFAFYYGTVSPATTNRQPVAPTGRTTSVSLAPGSYKAFVTATNTAGLESVPSNTLLFSVPTSPAPLTLVSGSSVSNVTFTWPASSESDLASYKFYYGLFGSTNVINVLTTPTNRVSLTSLTAGNYYWFYQTSVTSNNIESTPGATLLMSIPASAATLRVGP